MRTHRLAEECYAQTNRTETRDKHNISSGYIGTKTGSVGGAHATGYHCAIQIGQLIRECYQGTLFSQQKVGVSAVSLPPIGGAFGTGATNHPPTTAIMAYTAA